MRPAKPIKGRVAIRRFAQRQPFRLHAGVAARVLLPGDAGRRALRRAFTVAESAVVFRAEKRSRCASTISCTGCRIWRRRLRTIDASVSRSSTAGGTPHLGTTNAAWRAGSAYVEVIAIDGEPNAAIRRSPHWPALTSALSAGGGALAFAVLVDDVAAIADELSARDIAADGLPPGTLRLPDGSTGVWTSAILRDGPAWAPFFINYGFTVDEWIRRGRADSTAPWSFDHLEIETPDGGAAAAWLARVLGSRVLRVDQAIARIPLPGCGTVLVPGPADRITTVALTGPGAPTGEVAGLRYVRAAGRHDGAVSFVCFNLASGAQTIEPRFVDRTGPTFRRLPLPRQPWVTGSWTTTINRLRTTLRSNARGQRSAANGVRLRACGARWPMDGWGRSSARPSVWRPPPG